MTPMTRASSDLSRVLVGPDGGRIHALVRTPAAPARTAVLLLHQVPSSSWMWHRVMEVEALGGQLVVAPDLPGYGGSDAPQAPPRLEEIADHLVSCIRELHEGPLVVVGHHTGAMLAAVLLLRHPAIITSGIAFGLPYEREWQVRYEKMGTFERLAPSDDPEQLRRLWEYTAASFEPESDPAWALRAMSDRLVAGPAWFHGYVALHTHDAASTLRELRARDAPFELVYSNQDAVSRCAPSAQEDLGRAARWIDGRAWVTLEDPEVVAREIALHVEHHTTSTNAAGS